MNECDLVLIDNEELIFVLFIQYFSVDQIEKNDMGGECSMYGGEERFIQGFAGGNLM